MLPVYDPKKAGGALMDLNVYNLNLAVGLFGAPKSVEYFANVSRGIDTSGVLMLDYVDFKAVLIAAKDCKAPAMISIQGDEGCIISTQTMKNALEFQLNLNNGETNTIRVDNPNHRLYYEFKAFIAMIENRDVLEIEHMQKISMTVMKIMEKARWGQKIAFPNDRKIWEEIDE